VVNDFVVVESLVIDTVSEQVHSNAMASERPLEAASDLMLLFDISSRITSLPVCRKTLRD
jgi:hypothetical protein